MYIITALFGLAMIAAPWVLSYSNETTPMWASVILGAAIVLVSAYKAVVQDEQKWEYWVVGLAGVAAIAAPFALSFTASTAALWTSIVAGALALIVAAYELFFTEGGITQPM